MNLLCTQNAAPDYKQLYEQSRLRITVLEQQLQNLQKMIFGSRQERFIPASTNESQLLLDIPTETVAAVSLPVLKKSAISVRGLR